MFKFLRWVFLLVVLATIIGLAFLLGLSFGLGNNHDKFIADTVPVLSMLGGWVSGIGALAAVLTTLWLADKQRREDTEVLKVVSNASFPIGPGYVGRPFISLELTSAGKRPITVVAVGVTSAHGSMQMAITGFSQTSPVQALPVRLEYGQRASIHLQPGAEVEIARYVNECCRGRVAGLNFQITTTTGSWKGDLSQNLLTIQQMAEQIRATD